MKSAKEREIVQLLQDYNLKYPSGGQGIVNFEVKDAAFGSDWPLNGESIKRMGTGLVAESYRNLDLALTVLKGIDYPAYHAIACVYLVEEAAPNDLEFFRKKGTNPTLIAAHDRGLTRLGELLKNRDLYVRWPERHIKKAPTIAETHAEAYRIVNQFISEGQKKTEAVRNSATLTGLSVPTIWRVMANRS